jgi:hypothetical protein
MNRDSIVRVAEEKDTLRAYNLRVNSCITNPMDAEQYTKTVCGIEAFWLSAAASAKE